MLVAMKFGCFAANPSASVYWKTGCAGEDFTQEHFTDDSCTTKVTAYSYLKTYGKAGGAVEVRDGTVIPPVFFETVVSTCKDGQAGAAPSAADAAASKAKRIADAKKATEARDKAIADLKKSNPDATPAELEAAGKKAFAASIAESNITGGSPSPGSSKMSSSVTTTSSRVCFAAVMVAAIAALL